MKSAPVKKRRPYDARHRLERAERTREAVLDVARAAFVADGYAATTLAAVAERAGVSVETIYKAFGGKPGLVRAIFERGLRGRGDKPAESRSDGISANAPDGQTIVRAWGRFSAEIAPLVSPILLLMRTAAASDPELGVLLREHDEQRLARMRQNARVLAKRGFLRRGVTVERAAEIMWGYTSAEIYDLFVVRRGWTPERLGAFIADSMEAALLEPQ